jgi:succinate-semialdehyde dehydrogenase/glutarate-semialdehyde dehydrogenase
LLQERYDLLVAGKWVPGAAADIPVIDKYLLKPFATVSGASAEQITAMVDSAHRAFRAGAPVAYERGRILDHAAQLLAARMADFVTAMQREAGFTASDAAGEVNRCQVTLRLSAEEARRLAGDMLPFESAAGQEGRLAFTLRVPVGPVAAITPFNSPLNTVAHKVAPAFAAGNPVILKPASATPVTACLLAEVLLEAGMPEGFLSVLHCRSDLIQHLLDDQRIRFFAFTGSTGVGRAIQARAGLRRTQMELGSISHCVIADDANLDVALPKVISASYRKAGQVCTSIQVLLVHEKIFAEVERRLIGQIRALKVGDPRIEGTVVGPLISEAEAKRVEEWVAEAVDKGAVALAGGPRAGAVIPPVLLKNVDPATRMGCQEVFGPVLCLRPYRTLDEAIDVINATPFGLAAGIFTNRLVDALAAARRIEAGGVHINETSSSRVDLMPYGGSKESGFGREGPHYAVHEMTEERVVTIATKGIQVP